VQQRDVPLAGGAGEISFGFPKLRIGFQCRRLEREPVSGGLVRNLGGAVAKRHGLAGQRDLFVAEDEVLVREPDLARSIFFEAVAIHLSGAAL